jgi:hypothetical protein
VSLQGDVPSGFQWQGKTYRIANVATTWVEVAPWWIASALEKHVWRVEARRSDHVGTYELTSLADQWFVTRVFD